MAAGTPANAAWSTDPSRPARTVASLTANLRHLLGPLAGVLFFGLALWAAQHALREHSYREISAALRELPGAALAQALLLAGAGYGVLVGNDRLGFRFVARSLALRWIVFGSFVSYAIGNNVGYNLLGGATARYWIYTPLGVPAADIARIVLFSSLSFWLGFLALGAAAFILEPVVLPAVLRLPSVSTRPLGFVLLSLLCAYALLVAGLRGELHIRRWRVCLPSPALSAAQLVVGILDLLFMSAALWVLLPAGSPDYPTFLPVFLLALVTGAVSQVPGGLGVFESAVLLLLPPEVHVPDAVGALLAFRAIYYLAPLAAALLLVSGREAFKRKSRVRAATVDMRRWLSAMVPEVLAAATFVAGTVLLLSGAVPAAHGRLAWLARLLPLSAIEASHFLASLAGMALLVLARGLQRRLDGAYLLVVSLLALGIVLSLAKGFDYEEATLLAVTLAVIAPCRGHFYRRASLLSIPFTWGWIASITIIAAGSTWLYGFAFKHVEFSQELWWRFALHSEAPRALRATVGAIGLAVLFAVARLLAPARPTVAPASKQEIARAQPLVERSVQTYAHLALRGDKALLFSRSGNAFLMYGRRGRSWIAMGDPIGPRAEAAELAWQLRDLCDRHDGWPVFFEVGPQNLGLYLDLGLTLTKLGEEARVELAQFDLSGSNRSSLRQAHARVLRHHCRFEILPRAAVPAALPALARISEDWLAAKATREKGFSNASFDVDYLRQFPVALVRRAEQPIAFANLWLGAGKQELSVDLMRHVGDAPNGTMDFLFAELLLWGRAQGYDWFNFGMAPLSGLEERAGAPLWHRFGHLVYQYGEHFYNFRGLRHYKEKFGPVWTPRYLASPGGLALPAVMVDVTALLAGGFAGILAR